MSETWKWLFINHHHPFTHHSHHHTNSISVIFQMLHTRIWPIYESSCLGSYLTINICQRNIFLPATFVLLILTEITDQIWIKKYGKFSILGTPPQKKIISLKHLKFTKNHFKTNLFFVQLKHFKSTFTFGKKMKIKPPPLLSKGNFKTWS